MNRPRDLTEFMTWWHDEGSAMRPLPNEDVEEHAKRIVRIAWLNGAFKARDNSVDLSNKIARGIMESGDEPHSPCHRIQFKGGKWPEQEKDQGGFCESALASRIDALLKIIQ